jgi:hypothetical protein
MSNTDKIKTLLDRLTDEERATILRSLSTKKEVKDHLYITGLNEAITYPISYTQLEEMAVKYGAAPTKQKPGQKGGLIVKLLSKSAAKYVFPAHMVEEATKAHNAGKPLYPPGFLDAILNGKYDSK